MKIRHQPPVHSPISVSSLLAGLSACVPSKERHDHEAVRAAIADAFEPIELLLTDSGTSALTLAIHGACAVKGRDLVALPAYCCYDVATAADGADVDVVLYDLDSDTLGPDLDSLKAALEQKPAAVVLAHLYGVPIDYDALGPLLQSQNDVMVIEDAAQGHGATYRGRALGALGSLSVLSFGRGKGVTGGSGGALLANDEAGAIALRNPSLQVDVSERGFRNLVGAAAQWLLTRPVLYGIPASMPFLRLGETVYKPPHPPSEISGTAGAILTSIWKLALNEAETRKTNGSRLLEILSDVAGVTPTMIPSDGEAGYLRFSVVVEDRLQEIFNSITARKLGIMPGYPKSLADLPGFTDRCVNRENDFPDARMLANQLFTFPTHGMVGENDLLEIQQWLQAVAHKA